MKKIMWLVGLVVLFAPAFFHTAWAGMSITKMRSGFDQKVTELMILAQQAREVGDMANAELFWMHARELRPSLTRPAWLDARPMRVIEPPPPSEGELLARIAALPYVQAKFLLEEHLQKEPGNIRVRQLYLDLALKNADHSEVSRHRSILPKDASDNLLMFFWYAVVLVLICVLIWQLAGVYRDLRER